MNTKQKHDRDTLVRTVIILFISLNHFFVKHCAFSLRQVFWLQTDLLFCCILVEKQLSGSQAQCAHNIHNVTCAHSFFFF